MTRKYDLRPRGLSERETVLIPDSVGRAIDLYKVRFIPRAHNPFARNKILVRGYAIYWPDVPEDFSRQALLTQSILIHELCHVWQYATGRLTALRYLTNPANWYYRYRFDPEKVFDDYPIEKQADMLQDWFLINSGSPPRFFTGDPPTSAQINAVVPFNWDNQKNHT